MQTRIIAGAALALWVALAAASADAQRVVRPPQPVGEDAPVGESLPVMGGADVPRDERAAVPPPDPLAAACFAAEYGDAAYCGCMQRLGADLLDEEAQVKIGALMQGGEVAAEATAGMPREDRELYERTLIDLGRAVQEECGP